MGALTPPDEANIEAKPVPEDQYKADVASMEMGLVVTQEGEQPKNVVELVKAGAFSHLKKIDIDDKDMAEEVWGTMQALKKCRTTFKNLRLAITGPYEAHKKRLIKKEDDVVGVLEPEEKRLKAVYEDWEARRNDRAAEEERRENARIQERIQRVLATGAAYNETSGDYLLGDIALNATQVKILSDDGFAKAIASMEQAAEVKKKAEEAERQKEQRYRERKSEAFTIGAKYDGSEYSVAGSDMQATDEEMKNYSDPAWDAVTSSWRKAIQKAADDAKAEQERKDKEAKEAADKLEAERKKKEEDDAKMKAMRERVTKANRGRLVAAGWAYISEDSRAIMLGDEPDHMIRIDELADLTDEQLDEYEEQARAWHKQLQEKEEARLAKMRAEVDLLNKRKQVMFNLGFDDGPEVMTCMFLTDDPAHDLLLSISHEQLATQSEEGFAGYVEKANAAAAKHKEEKAEREAKAKEEEEAERNRPSIDGIPLVVINGPFDPAVNGSTPDIVPAGSGEDAEVAAAMNVMGDEARPTTRPWHKAQHTAPMTEDERLAAFREHYPATPEDVFAQPEATKTDAEKDAYWFTVWADLLQKESAEFEGRLTTEKAKAKFKAHKRYLDNVIDGIRKAAEQITQP